MTIFWLAARIAAFIPGWGASASGILGTLFFWYGAVHGLSVIRSQNQRNYVAVFALFVLGGTHAAFHVQLHNGNLGGLLSGLQSGLVMVSGFIGSIGNSGLFRFLRPNG